jgi:LysM repeat protein
MSWRFLKFLLAHPLCSQMFFLTVAWGLFFPNPLFGVRNRYVYEEENAILMREMRDSIDDIRHEANNHEVEIRMFEEKFKNQEAVIDALREQFTDANQMNKDFLKENLAHLETKITSFEMTLKGLVADLRQLKTHANDSSSVLTQYKQKISELEKIIDGQNQNIEHLQAAMRSLMEAIQVRENHSNKGKSIGEEQMSLSYRVKTGDSLEKIARSHQTTVSTIKELNRLTSDRIVVGQILQIPEK